MNFALFEFPGNNRIERIPIGSLMAILEEQQPIGTAGGTPVATTWTARALNTKVYDRLGMLLNPALANAADANLGVVPALSAGQFTLAPGNYEISWYSCLQGGSPTSFSTRLQNITDGITLKHGMGCSGNSGGTTFVSTGKAFLPILAAKILALQYWASAAGGSLGAASAPYTAWAITTVYTAGQQVKNGGNVYQCLVGGTSAGAGGPSGTAASITDNTVTWTYVPAAVEVYSRLEIFKA